MNEIIDYVVETQGGYIIAITGVLRIEKGVAVIYDNMCSANVLAVFPSEKTTIWPKQIYDRMQLSQYKKPK